MKGLVIKSTGSWYMVKAIDQDKIYSCRIIGKFRLDGQKLTNPVAVGDIVEFEVEKVEEETARITKVYERKNYLARKSPKKQHHIHLIASNLDQAFIVTTIVQPNLKLGFIDRFLMMAEPYDIPISILLNKADIYSEEDHEVFQGLKAVYENLGYPVHLVSAIENEGVEDLKALLKGKTTLFSGHSGVGKSTLINALDPSKEIKTTELSDFSGKGQHTTTFAEMMEFEFGAKIIDTPGIKSLAFNNMNEEEIGHGFREIFRFSQDCKFNDCMHKDEPKCAVKDAVVSGEIIDFRYENYLKILEETEDQNYWEINRDL